MDTSAQEECDRVDSEISFTELQDDSPGGVVVDDEDEVEELRNSLKEIVQDESIKPRLQCLMVDPSFSMVTVQSEDSGIVWETASSRCSTPWASEASSNSEAYSCEGSGTQGKIVIIMDEEKIVRRRKKTRGSKLGERLRRPSSRNFPGGNERPLMTEVSVPNIRPEHTDENGESAEPKEDKDQQLFSIVSEGYEILNIIVPSRLATVDEEESTEMADNLSYLEENPRIKSNQRFEQTQASESTPEIVEVEEDDKVIIKMEEVPAEPVPSEPEAPQTVDNKPTRREGTSDMDYFEKFTLVDEHIPEDQSSATEEQMETSGIQENEASKKQGQSADSTSAADDTFVFVSNVEIVGEHLDEVFYGASCYDELDEPSVSKPFADDEDEGHMDRGEPINSPLKESGAALFGSEETILTPIFLSPGPPKIIDPTLLEEPRAMSFHYMDLYEDAVGVKKRDEDVSDVESVVSETSFQRRHSDSDDASGYLEKFILKDETPVVEDEPIADDPPADGGLRMWSQSKFELTGCLTRVVEEDDTKEEERVTERVRSPSPYEEREEVMAMLEDKTEGLESQHTVTEEEGAVSGRKSSEMSDEVFEPQTEVVEKTEVKEKTEAEGSALEQLQSSDCVAEVTVVTPEEPCVETVCDKDTVKEEKDEPVVDHRPKSVCEEMVTENEEIIGKHEEAVVDQSTVVSHEERDTDITVVKPEETSEDISFDKEIVKGSVEELSEVEKPEILSEEIITDKEIEKGKIEESTEAERSKSVCEEIVTDSEEGKGKSEKDDVDQVTAISDQERETEITVVKSEITHEREVADKEMAKDSIEESSEAERVETVCEAKVTDKEIDKGKIEESMEIEKTKSIHEEIVVDAEDIKTQIEEAFTNELPEDKTEVTEIVPEPDKTEVTEDKIEEAVQKPESISETSRGDTEVNITCLESKDQDLSHADDICTGTAEEPADQKYPLATEEMRKDEDAPTAESEQIPDIEPQLPCEIPDIEPQLPCEIPDIEPQLPCEIPDIEPQLPCEIPDIEPQLPCEIPDIEPQLPCEIPDIEPQLPCEVSTEDETSLIKEKEDADLQGDTGPQHIGDSAKAADTAEEGRGDQTREAEDGEIQDFQEWHKASQSIPDSRPDRKRGTALLRLSPLVPVEVLEENEGGEQTGEEAVLMQEEGPCPPLRSFSPQEDLSAYGKEAMLSEPEPYQYLHHEEEPSEELDYEMITRQEARELPVPDDETAKYMGAGECPDGGLESEFSRDVPADEGLEADYEIVESLDGIPLSKAELEEREAKKKAMDTFCLACRCPISAVDKLFGNHQDHEVVTVDKAYDEYRNKLSEYIAVLQGRSENITDLVSELELAYNSVEEHCKTSERSLDEQNDEIMKMVMDQYNEMSHNMEEEKKVKLEQLYDRIVSFQESVDSAKEALDKTAKETEDPDDLAFVSSSTDINKRLTAALDTALSLELTPSAFPLFEGYAKTPSGNEHKELKGIPVPQKPHLQAQEVNSATSTSVTVYWKINEGDIIDCFQVYCMEEPQGAISEEYRVTVKESYCTLEDLEPDKCYKVWVMAVNYTGCSLPSEKLSFKTAPSVPAIDTERCTVCWDSATIRWSPAHPGAVESYTLEYCRQYACEGEGLRSISGIRNCEQKVLLHPNENYLFYIKAVNSAGASEQSEAALISTRGTRFHLLTDTASPGLELSEDKATVCYQEEAFNQRATINECPGILGELLPACGYHYWETGVDGSEAYRVGVAYTSTPRDSPLGENSTSWCIHCVPTATSCRFELLHDSVQTAVFVVDVPARIGTLLDFLHGRLSYYNAQTGQLLGSHRHEFTQACHAVLALEKPGSLTLHMVAEVPEFAKH